MKDYDLFIFESNRRKTLAHKMLLTSIHKNRRVEIKQSSEEGLVVKIKVLGFSNLLNVMAKCMCQLE
jgi:hypothetical protein